MQMSCATIMDSALFGVTLAATCSGLRHASNLGSMQHERQYARPSTGQKVMADVHFAGLLGSQHLAIDKRGTIQRNHYRGIRHCHKLATLSGGPEPEPHNCVKTAQKPSFQGK
jgi:hypothetical protein